MYLKKISELSYHTQNQLLLVYSFNQDFSKKHELQKASFMLLSYYKKIVRIFDVCVGVGMKICIQG